MYTSYYLLIQAVLNIPAIMNMFTGSQIHLKKFKRSVRRMVSGYVKYYRIPYGKLMAEWMEVANQF
jgi:hypothetical protein